MKKKILLLVPSLQQGGFQRVCVRTALLLKDTFEVTIAIFNGEDRAFDVGDIPVINLDIKSKPGKMAKVINVLKRIQKLKQLKKELQIDIAYSFGTTANLSNVLSKTGEWNWAGLRSYVDVNAFEMKIICREADLLVSCSKVIEEAIKARFHVKQITTVYNPFDMQEIEALANAAMEEDIEPFTSKLSGESQDKIVITMGREDDLKGYWHLLKSFAKVIEKCPNTKLVFMGRGEFTQYKTLAEQLGITEKVYFIGAKKNPFVYLKQADLYVLSSVHEGFPNALVEAMAVGLPVISTNCKSGPAEILQKEYTGTKDCNKVLEAEYGCLVPDMSKAPDFDVTHQEQGEEQLANAIINILSDTKTYEYYCNKAYERAKDFTTDAYVKALTDVSNRER